MAMDACCNPTVPWAMTMIGLPSILANPCAMAMEDSSWQQVISSGLLLPPWLMMDSCSARKLEPGLAQQYSMPSVLMTSTMKSAPGRSLTSSSLGAGGASVSLATAESDGTAAVE